MTGWLEGGASPQPSPRTGEGEGGEGGLGAHAVEGDGVVAGDFAAV